MKSPATFGARIAKSIRSGGDGIRHAYVVGRRVFHAKSHLARRRAARSAHPRPEVEVPLRDGYRLFAPGTFPEADESARLALALLEKSAEAVDARRKTRDGKQFLINLLDLASLTSDHPLLRLAIRPDLLEAITAYMGTVPLLRSIHVFYSVTMGREPISSQLYHCDADDIRQLKLFLLCSQVGRENGPLTILDATRSERVRRATGYTYRRRLTDEEVSFVIGDDAPFELVGQPGASCLVDTSQCFHFGSRVEAGAAPRLVAMAQYVTPFAFVLPGDCRRGATLAHLATDTLSPLQRAVLTGDHRYL